jgi:hypothetical protein
VTVQANVYRAVARDRHGDPVDASGNRSGLAFLGTLNVVLSNTSSMSVEPRLTGSGGANLDRSETADVVSLVGAPRNAKILLQHGDLLAAEGMDLKVVGPRLFDYPNSVSGWVGHKLYWIRVESTVG